MKVGFIVTIDESGLGSIKHKYGENAFFNISDYSTSLKSGDIVLFEFSGTRPIVTAKNIKLVKNETSFCREHKSKFHKSEWFLILKGNEKLFLEYVQKIDTETAIPKNKILKEECDYALSILLEIIKYSKPTISRWTYHKPGECWDSGLIHHNYFDLNYKHNVLEKIRNSANYNQFIHCSYCSDRNYYSITDLVIRDGDNEIAIFHFNKKIGEIFTIKDRLTIDEFRYNNDLNYKKQIITQSEKIHSKHFENLLLILTPNYLFDLFEYPIISTVEKEKKILDFNLYDWKYLYFFPKKKN